MNKLTLSNLTHVIHIICALFGDYIDNATSVDATDELDTVIENNEHNKSKMKNKSINLNMNRKKDKTAISSVSENDTDGNQEELQ